MNLRQLPNILTILRIILTLPLIFALLKGQYFLALVLLSIAGITDGLDGWIAKRYRYQSRFGSILDPLADKILLISCYTTLFLIHVMPNWLMFTVVIRDVMIIAGTVGFIYASDEYNKASLMPSNISKVNTVLQILLVFFMIIVQLIPVESHWIMVSWIVVFTSTVLSGIDYIWVWVKQMIRPSSAKE